MQKAWQIASIPRSHGKHNPLLLRRGPHLWSSRITSSNEEESYFSFAQNAIDAINETCKFSFSLDHALLTNIETRFRQKSQAQWLKGCLKGYLGAINGTHFSIINPGLAAPNPNRFCLQRKAKFALLYLACCHSNRKFTFLIVPNVLKATIL